MSDAVLDPVASPVPAPINSRALLREALSLAESLWNRQPAIWVIAVVVIIAESSANEAGLFGTSTHLLREAMSFEIDTILSAVCIRAILDHGGTLLIPDATFWRFVAIRFALGLPGVIGGVVMDSQSAAIAVKILVGIAALAYAIVSIRFIPWPVGALIGDPKMSARESWRLTRGGVLIIIGAFLQVTLVFFATSSVLVMLAFLVTLAMHSDIKYFMLIWIPIVSGFMFPFLISLDAAIYKLTGERAELPSRATG